MCRVGFLCSIHLPYFALRSLMRLIDNEPIMHSLLNGKSRCLTEPQQQHDSQATLKKKCTLPGQRDEPHMAVHNLGMITGPLSPCRNTA